MIILIISIILGLIGMILLGNRGYGFKLGNFIVVAVASMFGGWLFDLIFRIGYRPLLEWDLMGNLFPLIGSILGALVFGFFIRGFDGRYGRAVAGYLR